MKKLLFAIALFSFFSASNAQLLYKISGKGLKKPSYIVGTYHLAPGSYADSIPGLTNALAECQQIYGELDMQNALSEESRADIMSQQMLPDGVTLSSLLAKEQMDRLNALMRRTFGADMTNPMLAAQFDKLTPMAIAMTLTMIAYMKKVPDFNPMDLLDAHLQQMAIERGMAVKGFETSNYQAELLYNSPLEQQVEELMCMVDNFDAGIKIAEEITKAYFSQDLQRLEKTAEGDDEYTCNISADTDTRITSDRNDNWVKAMPAIMKEAPTFFAVGAAHLYGEKGVLRQLEEKGYSVEGVK